MPDYTIKQPNRFLENSLIDGTNAVGYSAKTMRTFKRDLDFFGGVVGSKVIQDEAGRTIKVSTNHGIDKITILGGSSTISTKTVIKRFLDCYCDCGITAGQVIKSPASQEDNPDEWTPDVNTGYGVELCQKTFLGYFGVAGLDWFAHRDNEPEEINGEMVPTRPRDNVYAVIGEKDITVVDEDGNSEQVHMRLPDIDACAWDEYYLLSIEPVPDHLIVETWEEEVSDY